MKIFLDTADLPTIRRLWDTGLIDGVTTNPTLIYKAGNHPESVYDELVELGVPDISMEVVGDYDEMLNEGFRLADKYKTNATIASCNVDGLMVCKELSKRHIRTNVTLIFRLLKRFSLPRQVLPMCLPLWDAWMISQSQVWRLFVLSLRFIASTVARLKSWQHPSATYNVLCGHGTTVLRFVRCHPKSLRTCIITSSLIRVLKSLRRTGQVSLRSLDFNFVL